MARGLAVFRVFILSSPMGCGEPDAWGRRALLARVDQARVVLDRTGVLLDRPAPAWAGCVAFTAAFAAVACGAGGAEVCGAVVVAWVDVVYLCGGGGAAWAMDLAAVAVAVEDVASECCPVGG